MGALLLVHLAVGRLIAPQPGISIPIPGCGLIPIPICSGGSGLSGIGSGIAGGLAGDVLNAIVQWVASAATWLLGQIAAVLSATTSVNVKVAWFTSHYQVMMGIGAVALLPMMLGSIIQAVVRQDAGPLIRMVVVQLPLAIVLTMVAIEIVQLALSATDALSATVSSGTGANLDKVFSGLADAIVASGASSSLPGLILLVGSLIIVLASFLLWIELLVRAAAIYVAVLFLPLVMASLVWPAISHWCRRLVETLAALILSKFVIVAVLSLAAGALASGTSGSGGDGSGFASVLGGGALLLLASFTPFTLMRLIPMAEMGAATQLEGARHRVTNGLGAGGGTRFAARKAMDKMRGDEAPGGMPGTGQSDPYLSNAASKTEGGDGGGGGGAAAKSTGGGGGGGAGGGGVAAGAAGAAGGIALAAAGAAAKTVKAGVGALGASASQLGTVAGGDLSNPNGSEEGYLSHDEIDRRWADGELSVPVNDDPGSVLIRDGGGGGGGGGGLSLGGSADEEEEEIDDDWDPRFDRPPYTTSAFGWPEEIYVPPPNAPSDRDKIGGVFYSQLPAAGSSGGSNG